ncbi:MAG: hypothetical protein LAN71_06060 [Acidobacteriia bacterium]|nr:hypothetical protein [Terriglobia bacterium]
MKAAAAVLLLVIAGVIAPRATGQERDEEIVANIAAGRVIIHAASEGIAFAVIEQAAEGGSLPPRVISINSTHIAVLFGAIEWQIPAGSKPLRVERGLPQIPGTRRESEESSDLEFIGVAFLEKLRDLAGRLHHKIDLGPEEPILQLVVIGYGPEGYGPEVWLYDYHVKQEALRGDYFQTKVLRPRTTQLYPPEKGAPRTLVEAAYPPGAVAPGLLERIERNDPAVARIAGSEKKFDRVVEKIRAGKAQSANPDDAAEFLRIMVVPIAGKGRFAVGTFKENRGFDWLLPPEEPVEKAVEDKKRPPEAPTLRRKPQP